MKNLRKNCMKIIVFMINVFITIRQRIFFFFQADIHGNLLIRQRMQVIRALLEREDEITVVTSIDGCMDYLAPLEKIEKQLIHFRNDSAGYG